MRMSSRWARSLAATVFTLAVSVMPVAAHASEADLILVACNVDKSYNCGGACGSLPSGSPCQWCCKTCNAE
jgi:hypothetical protein